MSGDVVEILDRPTLTLDREHLCGRLVYLYNHVVAIVGLAPDCGDNPAAHRVADLALVARDDLWELLREVLR